MLNVKFILPATADYAVYIMCKVQKAAREDRRKIEKEEKEREPIPFSQFKTEKLKSAYEQWYRQMEKLFAIQ